MKEKFLRFVRVNFIIWAYLAIAVFIELTGVCVTSGKFLIRRPFMFLSAISVFTCVLFTVRNQRARYWCAFSFLLAQFLIDLVFIVVFDMTGATFDYSMLNLRGDAMAIVESVPVDFVFVLVSGVLISMYMLLAHYLLKSTPAPQKILPRGAVAGIMAAILLLHAGVVYFENRNENPADLSYKLNSGYDGTYYDKGILGNFIDELYKGAFFGKVPLVDAKELEDFVYSSQSVPTSLFGKAEGYNVVTVLAESFEWFGFMNDLVINGKAQNAFPEGFRTDESTLRKLYPNLYRLYDESVVCLNHHAREKTDISENQSIIGCYPSNCYINYEYADNTVPFSLPNILKSLYGVQSYSFHNGNYTFYNRNVHHEHALGFAEYTAREQMDEMGSDKFTDYKARDNEYNLDSEMIDVCKQKMFPADRRFNTYITTITMHGQYEQRKNLQTHYNTLAAYGITAPYTDEEGNLEENKPFIHYAAAALEFDKAMGVMLDYLENTRDKNGDRLIDKTIITVFGDHNAYYQTLSPDVKQLYLESGKTDDERRNYTDLFRVPMMIRIGNVSQTLPDSERIITKFTTTTDIVPTVLDLLGVRFYNSLNYGRSVFDDTESIIYSRAYNVFITDKLFFASLNNIKYQSDDVTDEYIELVRKKATELLDKTSRVNQIFYYNFLSDERANTYYTKLHELNKS